MNRSKSLGIALASVLVIGAALGLAGFALASAAPHQTPLVCAPVQGQANTCSLTMATYPDSGEGVHGKDGDRTRTGSPTRTTTSCYPPTRRST